VARVPQELKGFAKVHLAPGEKQTVTMTLTPRSFTYYDVPTTAWLAESGPVEIRMGSSSRDIRLRHIIELKATQIPQVTFTLGTTKFDLMRHPIAATVFGPFFHVIGSIFHEPALSGDSDESKPIHELAPTGRQDESVEEVSVQSEANPLARLEEEMALHMPLRSYPLISHGRISEASLLQKIIACNDLILKQIDDID
jgi:hypothetical protein